MTIGEVCFREMFLNMQRWQWSTINPRLPQFTYILSLSSSSSSSVPSALASRGIAAGGLKTLTCGGKVIGSSQAFVSPSAVRLVPRMVGECCGDVWCSPSLSRSVSPSAGTVRDFHISSVNPSCFRGCSSFSILSSRYEISSPTIKGNTFWSISLYPDRGALPFMLGAYTHGLLSRRQLVHTGLSPEHLT
jgi:hypothetical protein